MHSIKWFDEGVVRSREPFKF